MLIFMNKNLRIIIDIAIVAFATIFSVHQVIAATEYTAEEVATHNTSNSCWAIYNNGVYNITSYLSIHNQWYNITSWCGTDITANFDAVWKHQGSAQALLESFKVGTLASSKSSTTQTSTSQDENLNTQQTNSTVSDIQISNPYNVFLPIFVGVILYWGHYLIVFGKKERNPKQIKSFNAFWNTIMLLSLLIPTLGFGLIMIMQYTYPSLAASSFNFRYWHVELALFMSVLAISHLIVRFRIYKLQLKKS